MSRPIRPLVIDAEQRKELTRLIQRPKATQREVRRAAIILGRVEGLSQEQTAERVAVNRPVVEKWEKRFRDEGIRGLSEVRRPG